MAMKIDYLDKLARDLLKQYKTKDALFGNNGVVKELQKRGFMRPLGLDVFSRKWDTKYPSISQSWMRHCENVTPFFAYPTNVRRAIYTTNAIESMNMTLYKVIKNKRVFPNDESVFKLLYLAINNISKK